MFILFIILVVVTAILLCVPFMLIGEIQKEDLKFEEFLKSIEERDKEQERKENEPFVFDDDYGNPLD